MKNRATRILLCTLAALALAAGACTNTELDPIFYTLEKEQPLQDDKGLEDTITVVKMFSTGTRYFAAAGSLFTRTDPAADWRKVAPAVSGALCNAAAYFDGELYAGFFSSGDPIHFYGLYRSDPDTISWTAVPGPANQTGDGVQIGFLQEVRAGELLVGTRTSGTYYLYSYGAGGPVFGGGISLSGPMVDAAWDSVSSVYWVAAGATLYSAGTVPALTPQSISPVTTTGANFGGLLYSAAGNLYASTAEGHLFYSADSGVNWADSGEISADGDVVPFTRFVDVSLLTGGDEIYAGSGGYGYFATPATGLVTTGLTRSPGYNITALYKGAINSFFLDVGHQQLYICTSGAGLWRGQWNGSEFLWKQE